MQSWIVLKKDAPDSVTVSEGMVPSRTYIRGDGPAEVSGPEFYSAMATGYFEEANAPEKPQA